MKWKKWDALPARMQNDAVRPYYEHLKGKRVQLAAKRAFDVAASSVMIVALSPALAGIAVWIKKDSDGPALFRQVRVTQYGREFRICKFRTMVTDAEKIGAQVTGKEDPRITKVGRKIRKARIDELPQLFNILKGDMSFVGTRPEVPRYVEQYTDEMMATLLLPAGVTSKASIEFKDEDELMEGAADPNKTYVEEVLPLKMAINLQSLKEFSLCKELGLMVRTVLTVLG